VFLPADGKRWHDAGPVFDGGALGQRQWAGSALYDDGEVYLYYTAAGDEAADEMTYTQRIAVAHGGTASADEDGIELSGPWTHETLLTPDGEWYETEAQSRGMTYTFRDPWFFEDSATGETHLLFEANAPAPERPGDDEATAHRREFNGCVGVAVSESGDPLSWEPAPLLDAVEVNQELERPHVVVADGRYYLFVCSHVHTFAPGVTGPDGLYGFVADALDGEYRPRTAPGSSPRTRPKRRFQAYSWMAFAHDEEVLVQSFLNYYDFAGDSLDAIADLPEAEQRERFGGDARPDPPTRARRRQHPAARNARRVAYSHPDEPLPPADDSELPGGDALSGRLREGGSGGGYAGDRAARSTAKAITRSATPKRETTAALTALFKYRAARELASRTPLASEVTDQSVGVRGAESDRLRRVDRNVRMPSGRRLIPDRPISSGMQRSTSQKRPWLAALLERS